MGYPVSKPGVVADYLDLWNAGRGLDNWWLHRAVADLRPFVHTLAEDMGASLRVCCGWASPALHSE